MKSKNNKFSTGEQTTARAICNETILLSWDKETSQFFLLTSETPSEVFTAGFLELWITWLSEIVKYSSYSLQLMCTNERRKTSY